MFYGRECFYVLAAKITQKLKKNHQGIKRIIQEHDIDSRNVSWYLATRYKKGVNIGINSTTPQLRSARLARCASPVLRWLMWIGLSCNTTHCHKGGTISGLKGLRTCKARSNYMGWMSLRDLKGILITNLNDITRHIGRRYRHLVHHLHRRPMQHWCRSLLSVAKHFGNSACHVQPFGAPEMHHVSPSHKCTQMKYWHTLYQHGLGVGGFTWSFPTP